MNQLQKIGITALVPPELLYSCGKTPCDLNNFVPGSKMDPKSKLCAWTATWREMVLKNQLSIDVHENTRLKVWKHFFFYPFDNDIDYLESQLNKLSEFLSGIQNPEMFNKISQLKELGIELDKKRADGKLKASTIFPTLISFSDMKGNPEQFKNEMLDKTNE